MPKTIKVPILNDEYKVCVMWDCTPEQVQKHFEKHFEEKRDIRFFKQDKETQRGSCYVNSDFYPFIVVWDSKKEWFWGTLAHEAFHAVEHICDQIGQEIKGEFVAHSIGAIVRAVAEYKK